MNTNDITLSLNENAWLKKIFTSRIYMCYANPFQIEAFRLDMNVVLDTPLGILK